MDAELIKKMNSVMDRVNKDPKRAQREILDTLDEGAWYGFIERARATDRFRYGSFEGSRFEFYNAKDAMPKADFELLCAEIPEAKVIYKQWVSDLDKFCAENPEMDIMRELWSTEYSGENTLPSRATLEFLLLTYDFKKYDYWAKTVLEEKHQGAYQTWGAFLNLDFNEYIKEKAPEGELTEEVLADLRKTWKEEIFKSDNNRFSAEYSERYKGELELKRLSDSLDFVHFLNYDAAEPEKKEHAS